MHIKFKPGDKVKRIEATISTEFAYIEKNDIYIVKQQISDFLLTLKNQKGFFYTSGFRKILTIDSKYKNLFI